MHGSLRREREWGALKVRSGGRVWVSDAAEEYHRGGRRGASAEEQEAFGGPIERAERLGGFCSPLCMLERS